MKLILSTSYKKVILLFLSFISPDVYGQYNALLFDYNSGLPSNYVHDCAESNTGKLWIATDKGLACYNGYEFRKIGLEEGLTTMFSWGFFKDKKERLWLRNRQAPFTYIYNDSVHRIGKSDLSGISFDFINEDEKGNVYISSLISGKTHCVNVQGKITVHDSLLLIINSRGEQFWKSNRPLCAPFTKVVVLGDFFISIQGHPKIAKKHIIEVWNTITDEKTIVIPEHTEAIGHISRLDPQHVLVSMDNGIFRLDVRTKKLTPYGNSYNSKYKNIVVIYKDRFNNTWLCDYFRGIWFEKATESFIKYKNISDSEKISTYSRVNDHLISLTTYHGILYTINREGKLSRENKREPSYNVTVNPHKKLRGALKGFSFNSDGTSLNINEGKNRQKQEIILNQWIKTSRNSSYYIQTGGLKCHKISDSTLSIGTSAGIYTLSVSNDRFRLDHWHKGYVFDFFRTGRYIYSAGLTGLKKIDTKTRKTETLINNQSFINVFVLNGIIYVKSEDGTIYMVSVENNRIIRTVSSLKDIYRLQLIDNTIWGLGMNRILQIDPVSFKPVMELTSFDGITTQNILGVDKLGDYFYIFCETDYYQVDLKRMKRTLPESQTNFSIESIFVNGHKSGNDHIRLNGENNSVRINLQCIYFPYTTGVISYYYRIDDGKWNISDLPSINILNLPYGHYKLSIKAKLRGESSFFQKQIVLDISNPIPFYKSYIFIVSISVLLAVGIAFSIISIRKLRIKRIRLQFEMTQNRMKMLVMQMKPHFLSNIFNSLQNSFIEEDIIKSSMIIKNLDNYLRNILYYSRQDFISLNEEIKLVIKYTELEQSRITKKISLFIAPELEKKAGLITIPVFILQPIIENAIWHGIQKTDHPQGLIHIDLSENENYFIISVRDNGIGIGNSNHKGNSLALENINERLSIMDNNKKEQYLFIESLEQGTKVNLYVAKKIKNHTH